MITKLLFARPLSTVQCLLLLAFPATAQSQTLTWTTNFNNTITITGFTGPREAVTNIVIPSAINGLPVTAIGTNAFACRLRLTGVVIPDGVTHIMDGAFAYCYSLTSLAIPGSVTNLGKSAFRNCIGLTNISLGYSVSIIGERAFHNCPILVSITIPKNRHHHWG